MSHFTSLLMCLISAVNNVAALQNVKGSVPEARSGLRPWEERYGAISPKSFHPPRPDGIRGSQEPNSVIDPKGFRVSLEGPGTDQDMGSSQTYSGKSDNLYKQPKDSKQPAWNLKLSFPSIITTEAPTTKQNVFRYLASSQGKVWENPPKFPVAQKPDYPNHKQSQLVKFLDRLLHGGSSEQSGQTQQDKVVFKPVIQQLSHSHTIGSFPSSYNPNLYGMGQAEGGTHAPIYQSAPYTPKWFQAHKPQISDDKILQVVNGRLMMPVDKCPGYEKLIEEYLKGNYHLHGQFPYGYIHQHGQPPKVQTPQQVKPLHVEVYQQGQNFHGHVYKPWTSPPPTSPTYPTMSPYYTQYYQYGGGPAPNPTAPSQEPNDYLKWLQNKYPGGHQQYPNPGQTYTYVYQEPDKQQQQQSGEQPQHFHYRVPAQSGPYHTPSRWR